MPSISTVRNYDALKSNHDAKQKTREPIGGGLAKFGDALANGAAQVASVVAPIGLQVAQGAIGSLGGGPVGSLVSNTLGGVTGTGGSESQQQAALIQLQREVNRENLYFQTVSNIEKANNDSKSNTVRSIKP